jgi:hypothetical protein
MLKVSDAIDHPLVARIGLDINHAAHNLYLLKIELRKEEKKLKELRKLRTLTVKLVQSGGIQD